MIRSLDSLDEYRACVDLQEEIWGAGFSEKVPVAVLMMARKLGGVVAGAFDEAGALVGFVFGLTGWVERRPMHWSDMLAVRSDHRNRGIAVELKAFQRRELLAAGVQRASWSFDPLESKNAHLNLGKLGGVVREYVPDMYGRTGSALHGELPTDRFIVSWELDADRVRDRLAGSTAPPAWEEVRSLPEAFAVEGTASGPRPGTPRIGPLGPRVRVPVPAAFSMLRARDPDLAFRWRKATRQVLVQLLGEGYEARELVQEGTLSHYLLIHEAVKGRNRQKEEA